MGTAELKEIKARSREVNDAMRLLKDSIGQHPAEEMLQIPRVLAEVVIGMATLSAMVERMADHLLE